jgi:hypothetical protein
LDNVFVGKNRRIKNKLKKALVFVSEGKFQEDINIHFYKDFSNKCRLSKTKHFGELPSGKSTFDLTFREIVEERIHKTNVLNE